MFGFGFRVSGLWAVGFLGVSFEGLARMITEGNAGPGMQRFHIMSVFPKAPCTYRVYTQALLK